ncbi:hypothetical protein SOVF_050450 [Spinacia oleracea]|nr:hypothetical protein SOVF_050450 [Spinacia oleracea]
MRAMDQTTLELLSNKEVICCQSSTVWKVDNHNRRREPMTTIRGSGVLTMPWSVTQMGWIFGHGFTSECTS